MPNGGSDNCGECCFFSKNIESTSRDNHDKFRFSYCTLRLIVITQSPFWTYCENYSQADSSSKAEVLGAVYVSGGTYPYSRKVWISDEKQKKLMKEQKKIADFARESLNLANPDLGDEFTYLNLQLSIIDAVFSIGANYTSTNNVIKRFRGMFCQDCKCIPESEKAKPGIEFTIGDLVDIYKKYSFAEMADKVYKNRQRTSTRNGILKAEAVLKFSRALLDFGVDRLEDVEKIIGNPEFEAEIKNIPGQGSGISLCYFYILVGAKDYVKPDRMIQKLLSNLLSRKVKIHECQPLIFGASLILEKEFKGMRACILDHLMWKYQSGRIAK